MLYIQFLKLVLHLNKPSNQLINLLIFLDNQTWIAAILDTLFKFIDTLDKHLNCLVLFIELTSKRTNFSLLDFKRWLQLLEI